MNEKAPSNKSAPQDSNSATQDASARPNSPGLAPGHALVPGLEGRYEADVLQEWTRSYFQAHLPAVFSTPAMIGMMEGACAQAIDAALPAGMLSVGTRIEVDHLKAVPVGGHVVATARLVEVNGRFLVFEVAAYYGDAVIGRGRIVHAVVDLARFARIAAEGPKNAQASSNVTSSSVTPAASEK
jgi:fluoroacetyl-CoA thioesterase